MKKSQSPGKISNERFLDDARSDKVTGDVLCQGTVITDDLTTARFVGKGSLLRIRVTALTYIACRASDADLSGAVSVTTSPGLELPTAGTYLVTASEDWIKASANPARVEKLSQD